MSTTALTNIVLKGERVAIEAKAQRTPTVSILAYSGGVMNVPGVGPVVIDLAGLEIAAAQVPILADHESRLAGIVGHTYGINDPMRTVQVCVTDASGNSATGTFDVQVVNASPIIETVALSASQIQEGDSITLSGTFHDTDPADSHTLAIDWGDGGAIELVAVYGGAFSLSHRYLDDDPTGTPWDLNVISLRLSDDHGGENAAWTPLTIANVAPGLTGIVFSADELEEGRALTVSGNIADPGTEDELTLRIDWGDGATHALILPREAVATPEFTWDPSGGTFRATRIYADDAPSGTPWDAYTVSVSVMDDDEGWSGVQSPLTVRNVAPVLINIAGGTVDEGSIASLTMNIHDTGVYDVLSVEIDWLDGTGIGVIDDLGSADISGAVGGADGTAYVWTAATRQLVVSHRYRDDSASGAASDTCTVMVSVRDDDTGASSASSLVTILDVAPSIIDLATNVACVDESGWMILSGGIVDPGILDTFTLDIDWGDGSIPESIALGNVAIDSESLTWNPIARRFFARHAFLDDHPTATGSDLCIIAVCAIDKDGLSSVPMTIDVTVNNVAPSQASIRILSAVPAFLSSDAGSATVHEGTLVTLESIFTDPGTLDTFCYLWHVQASNGQVVAQGTTPSFSLAPRDNGAPGMPATYTITVSISDDDLGTTTSSAFVLTVVDQPPTLDLAASASSIDEMALYTLQLGEVFDPGEDVISGYQINWGDGTIENHFDGGSPAGTTAHHTYADGPRHYAIRVALIDEDGIHASAATHGLTVTNVAPRAILTHFGSIDQGAAGCVLFTSAFDPSAADTAAGFRYAYDFDNDGVFDVGDGSYGGSVASALMTIPAGFLLTPGIHTVRACIIDQHNGATDYTTEFQVHNVAPAVNLPASHSTTTDGVTSLHGSFTDPGADGPWTGTVDFGDGSGVQALTVNSNLKTFALSHRYTTPGDYTVSVVIRDHPSSIDGIQPPAEELDGMACMNVTVAATSLQVVHFLPTPSGFDFTFNRAIAIEDLLLFGPGHFDKPIRVAGSDGQISGSVVWDAAANILHWVKTGGILEADTYEITLVSGTSGNTVHDSGALDGNADNVAGDDFHTTVEVQTTDARVLSIPDFARGQGQTVITNARGVQTGSTGLPLYISDGAGVQSAQFTLHFDPALLSISTNPADLDIPDGWSAGAHLVSPGVLKVVLYSNTAEDLGAGPQAIITFRNAVVPADSPYGGGQMLTISDILLNEALTNPIAAIGDRAIHKALNLGDGTGDGTVGGLDASHIARIVVGLYSGLAIAPLTDPLIICDLTGDGTLSGLDASAAAQMFTNPAAQPQVPIPLGQGTVVAGVDPVIRTGLGASAMILADRGSAVPVEVRITDDAGGLLAADLHIAYDTDLLDLSSVNVALDSVLQALGWSKMVNVNDGQGLLRVSIYSAESPLTAGPAGLLTLQFSVPASAPSGTSPILVTGINQVFGSRLNEGQLVISNDTGAVTVGSAVMGRYLFYHHSAFDIGGHDNAIASDKTALLPGHCATFDHYSSYGRGINGIMVDIAAPAGTLSADDFVFRVGNDDHPDGWNLAPAACVNVRPGAGAGGSTRVEITWPDNAIQKQWLQVTVLANANTGLTADDVFYFGNAIGDTGDSLTDTRVTTSDEIAARAHPTTRPDTPLIANAYDFDRDGQVDALDQAIARANATSFLNALRLICPPVNLGLRPVEVRADTHQSMPAIQDAAPERITTACATADASPAPAAATESPAPTIGVSWTPTTALVGEPHLTASAAVPIARICLPAGSAPAKVAIRTPTHTSRTAGKQQARQVTITARGAARNFVTGLNTLGSLLFHRR